MNHLSPLIHSSIGMTAADFQELVSYIKARTIYERDLLGWGDNRFFKSNTLFAKWAQVERQVEQDFKDRVQPNSIYEDSNLSQNLPFTIASQHLDRITRDLLDGPKFFDVNPEGDEDARLQAQLLSMQPPILEPGQILPQTPQKPTETLMRVLHKESRVRNLHSTLAKGVQNALFRGHEILRPSYERRQIPKRVQVNAWQVNGVNLRDSKNKVMMCDQGWQSDPSQPPEKAEIVSLADPRIRLPAGTLLTKSPELYGVNRMTTVTNGCDVKPIYWADFVIPVISTWEDADFRGHFFRASVDDIMSMYPKETWTNDGGAYWKRHIDGGLGINQRTFQVVATEAVLDRGEQQMFTQDSPSFNTKASRQQRTFFEWWGRYDADKDGYAEPLHIVLDWEDETVIRMEGANIVLPWMEAAMPNPYLNMRIFPVDKRWYGNGYYDVYSSWHLFGDRCWNQAVLDMENSGNLFFQNRGAYVNPNDADNLGFRTGLVYDILSSAETPIKTVSVASTADTYLNAMDRVQRRMQAHGGTMGAADPATSALPGADTLGGLNKILEQGDVFVSARERELMPALNEAVRQVADIMVYAIKQDPKAMMDQVGEMAGGMLLQFLNARPEHVRDLIEVNLSKAFGSGQVQTAQAIIQSLGAWMGVPSLYKAQFRPAYELVLRGLGVSDPKTYLADPEAAMLAQQAMMQQPVQPGAPPAGGSPAPAGPPQQPAPNQPPQ